MESLMTIMNDMSSVERIQEYVNKDYHEADWDSPKAPENWIQKAPVIKIRNLKVKYRANLPFVINGVDLDFEPREKIGIVGRTGSGKSTILLTLMRILEVEEDSKIEMDGVDISKVGLYELRKRIEIIP